MERWRRGLGKRGGWLVGWVQTTVLWGVGFAVRLVLGMEELVGRVWWLVDGWSASLSLMFITNEPR